MPTSTVSGTASDARPPSVRGSRPRPRRRARRGTSNSSSSCTVRIMRPADPNGGSRERRVHVDHRALQDVGGGALDRHVDGDALGRRRGSGRCGWSAPAPAAAGRTSSSRRRSLARPASVWSMKPRTRGKPAKYASMNCLRRLLRHADVLRERERRLAVEQRVVDDLRAAPQLVRIEAAVRARTPSARSDRGCRRRAGTPRSASRRPTGARARAARSASSRPRSARGRARR